MTLKERCRDYLNRAIRTSDREARRAEGDLSRVHLNLIMASVVDGLFDQFRENARGHHDVGNHTVKRRAVEVT